MLRMINTISKLTPPLFNAAFLSSYDRLIKLDVGVNLDGMQKYFEADKAVIRAIKGGILLLIEIKGYCLFHSSKKFRRNRLDA